MSIGEPKVRLSDYGYSILQIETYGRCNMECSFCPYPLRDDKESKLGYDYVESVLGQINHDDPSFEYVTFSQFNEPLLDKRIFDFIALARRNQLKTLLITNGLLLENKRITRELFDHGPDKLKISLQTLDDATFGKARGVKINLDKYYKKIFQFLSDARKFQNLEVVVDIGCNFKSTQRVIFEKAVGWSTGDPAVPNDPRELATPLIQFMEGLRKLDAAFGYTETDISQLVRSSDQRYTQSQGFSLAPNIEIKVKPFSYGRAIDEYYPATHDFSCANRILGIVADGSVVPCCLMYDSSVFSMGNIRTQNLNDIMTGNQKFLSNLRTKNLEKVDICRKCFGQPTRRGVLIKNITQKARKLIET